MGRQVTPEEEERVRLSIHWNAGYKGGRRAVTNVLVGASWSHSASWPERTIIVYLGLWTASLVIPKRRGLADLLAEREDSE
jgi:hypothetical protein